MYYPSEKEFIRLTKKGNLVPVFKEIFWDLETPVSAYLKMATTAKYSFLLESVEGEEKVARYSFLASEPELVFQSKNDNAVIIRFKGKRKIVETRTVGRNPLKIIKEIMSAYRFVSVAGLPRFCGGMVGYIGYDVVRFFEDLPAAAHDDLNLPDMVLVLAKDLVIFDHRHHKIKAISCVHIPAHARYSQKQRAYRQALAKIDATIKKFDRPLPPQNRYGEIRGKIPTLRITSNFSRKSYQEAVLRAKKKIKAGDIIQVVPSQRFCVHTPSRPFNIYRVLRSVNPSPYMYYLNFDGTHIIGSSPELLVRCEDRVVETRPIAGTRRRGKDDKEDAQLVRDLLRDPKERAEHTMLVDLGRNDLGRICKIGTVKVSEFMAVEKYSHVMHIVSNVKGLLRNGKDIYDVLQAAFPAGTVTGAPKIRAMEIISELEHQSRGPYAGCVGYFSFSGNLDTCITIRTIVAKNNRAYVQAGGGIVADSNPQKEYQETINKAKAQIMAIETAQKQFEN